MRLRNWVQLRQISQFFAVSLLLVWATSARAQTVVGTVPAGPDASAVAVNTFTNKIYVAGGGAVEADVVVAAAVAVVVATGSGTSTLRART